MIVYWMGEAPRYFGSNDGCAFNMAFLNAPIILPGTKYPKEATKPTSQSSSNYRLSKMDMFAYGPGFQGFGGKNFIFFATIPSIVQKLAFAHVQDKHSIELNDTLDVWRTEQLQPR